MRISHQHKFVFIAIPRTGSTALRSVLDDSSDVKSTYKYSRSAENPFYHHISAEEIKEIFASKSWDWDEYTKFCVIRNPYDRAVSLYHHRIETGARVAPDKSKLYNAIRKFKYKHFNSKDFASWLKDEKMFSGLARSQSEFVLDKDGNELVDHFVRFENLQDDFNDVAAKIGIGSLVPVITKINSSKERKAYREYYDDDLKDLIKSRYEYEFTKFGYEF